MSVVKLLDGYNAALYVRATVGNALYVSVRDAIPAGSNIIGQVYLSESLPVGTNVIGAVKVLGSPGSYLLAISSAGEAYVDIRKSLPTGSNVIGKVKIADETLVRKNKSWTGVLSNFALWTPAMGKKFVVKSIFISFGIEGQIRLFDNTDSESNMVYKGYFSTNGGAIARCDPPQISSSADNVLKLTIVTSTSGHITVLGWET